MMWKQARKYEEQGKHTSEHPNGKVQVPVRRGISSSVYTNVVISAGDILLFKLFGIEFSLPKTVDSYKSESTHLFFAIGLRNLIVN